MSEQLPVGELDWRLFFDALANRYDENPFAQHTSAEVEFFLQLFPLAKGARILDVGCGTGRHALELARQGFRVTGLDFSEGMLAVAKKKADEAGLSVNWVLADALDFNFEEPYDAALSVCEGAIGLLKQSDNAEDHDAKILHNIARSLRSGGAFLLTALNGYRAIRNFRDEDTRDGIWEPKTMLATYHDEWVLPDGVRAVPIRERLFIAPEMIRMLESAGFALQNLYGGTAGQWARRPLSLDEVEAMYVCRKK